MDRWFAELDTDNSGALDESETRVLLSRMGEDTNAAALKKLMLSLDHDGSGQVSKTEFESWYNAQLTSLVGTPFDVLFGTTNSRAYWWFMQVLWLKTLVNMLYTFGIGNNLNWHVWMHVLLAASVILIVNQHPYISKLDQQVELFALLALATIAHVASIFKAGTTWDPNFLFLTGAVFSLPIVTFLGGKFYMKLQAKNEIERHTGVHNTCADDVASGVSRLCARCSTHQGGVQEQGEAGCRTTCDDDKGDCAPTNGSSYDIDVHGHTEAQAQRHIATEKRRHREEVRDPAGAVFPRRAESYRSSEPW